MAKWQPRTRRHDGQVRINRPRGGHLDLTPNEAWTAACEYRSRIKQVSREGGDCLDLGVVVPALGGVVLTTDLVLLFAAQLCTTSLAIEAEWCQAVAGIDAGHVHVEVGAAEVVRWAGDPNDYPPPSADDLAGD